MKNNTKNMTSKVNTATVANTTILTFDDAIAAIVNVVLVDPTNSAALTNAIRTATSAYAPAATDTTTDTTIDALGILDLVLDKVYDQLRVALKSDTAINMAKAVIALVVKQLHASYESAVDDLKAAFAQRSGYVGTYIANAILLSSFTVDEVKVDTNDRLTATKATLTEKINGLTNAKATVKDPAKLAEIEATAKGEIKDLERQVKRLQDDLTRLAAFKDSKAIAKIGLKVNQHGERGAYLIVNQETDETADTITRLPRWATGEEKPIWVSLEPDCGVANNTKRGDMLGSLIKIEIKEVGKKARFLGFKGSR